MLYSFFLCVLIPAETQNQNTIIIFINVCITKTLYDLPIKACFNHTSPTGR